MSVLAWLPDQPLVVSYGLGVDSTAIHGLWGKGIKGVRDPSKKRPGSWRQFLEEEDLLPEAELFSDVRL